MMFSDKLVELIPLKMAHSKRRGDFIRRILEQYEQLSNEEISDHTVSCACELTQTQILNV